MYEDVILRDRSVRDKIDTADARMLKRDIGIALFVKMLLIAVLIFGCKYMAQEKKASEETERYPIITELSQE